MQPVLVRCLLVALVLVTLGTFGSAAHAAPSAREAILGPPDLAFAGSGWDAYGTLVAGAASPPCDQHRADARVALWEQPFDQAVLTVTLSCEIAGVPSERAFDFEARRMGDGWLIVNGEDTDDELGGHFRPDPRDPTRWIFLAWSGFCFSPNWHCELWSIWYGFTVRAWVAPVE